MARRAPRPQGPRIAAAATEAAAILKRTREGAEMTITRPFDALFGGHVVGPTAGSETGAGARAFTYDPGEDFDPERAQRYEPTKTINPPRPRTLAADYDREAQTMRITFRSGAQYDYFGVEPRVWRNFRRAQSPGRYINRVLNFYPYAPVDER